MVIQKLDHKGPLEAPVIPRAAATTDKASEVSTARIARRNCPGDGRARPGTAAGWNFSRRSQLLLYQQVADVIRQRIGFGEYAPRTAIPSITKLTAEFGVAEVSVRKALDMLKREGVLITTPGRGTFVASRGG